MKRIEYGSIGAVVESALARGRGLHADNARFADDRMTRVDLARGRDDYYGPHVDVESVRRSVATPHPDVLAAVERARDALRDAAVVPQGGRRRRVRSRLDAGDELCEDAWLRRDPDAWSRVEKTRAPRRNVRLLVNMTIAAAERRENLAWRGAAVAALADLLTEQGASVEVGAAFADQGFSPDMPVLSCIVAVKPADAPLDLAAIATACADASFFRLCVLNAVLRDHARYRAPMTLGRVLPVAGEVAAGWDVVLDRDVTTIDRAREFVVARMAELSEASA